MPNQDAAAARVLNVARALRDAGHIISFISWGGQERNEDQLSDGVFYYDGFSYVVTNEIDFKGGIISKAKGWLSQGNKTKTILNEKMGQYDVILTYNCSLISWLVPFCKKNNIKLVADITEWYDYSELKPIMWLGYAFDMFYYLRRIKNKIVISKYLNKYYSASHNIIIPATCNQSEKKWHQGKDIANEKVLSFDGITLIYAGNPARKDAVHYAINAVQRLLEEGAKLRFLIIGIKREDYIKKYSDLLKSNILSEQIQFVGRVSQDDVPSYYALADFMVLLREQTRKSNAGFPTKFSESFTSGTPVIANVTSDMGEYLKDAETGFVVEKPTEDAIYRTLKEKVLTLNYDEIDRMKNRVKIVASQLDFHAYVEPLRDFIANLK